MKNGDTVKPREFHHREPREEKFLNKNSVSSALKSSQREFPLKEITERIISCSLEVHSTLGPGLLESVYEEALAHEFSLRKIEYQRQREVSLKYKGKEIGKHRIDYLVEDKVVVELKAVETLHRIYEAQVLTYLRAMDKRVGLLINFNVVRLKEGLKRLIL
jgi:GxxExxY protein